jgi:hypothetical protein
MPMMSVSFGYDDLYLIGASLAETLEGCLRREQDARAAGDTYKAAFEAQRSRKYRRLLEITHHAMATCNKSTARLVPIPASSAESDRISGISLERSGGRPG